MARVRLFANLRELAGSSEVDVDGATIGAIADALSTRFGPDFAGQLATARIWRNGDEAENEDPVAEHDEIAVIPPVSGGFTMTAQSAGVDSLLTAALMLGLIAANSISTAVLTAAWVGVVALWIVNLVESSSDGDFFFHYQPALASVVVTVAAVTRLGSAGLGVAVVLSVILVMLWAVVRPSARDLTSMGASMLCAVISSISVGSIFLARSTLESGVQHTAGMLILVGLGSVAWRWAETSRSALLDPEIVGPLSMVLVSMLVAYMSGFSVITWFFVGLLLALSAMAGVGIGSAFRTGGTRLTHSAQGVFPALDGPVLAVAVFMPVLWMLG